MKKDELHGNLPNENALAVEREAADKTAADALQRSDANELFTLYEKAVRDRTELMNVVKTISDHFIGGKDVPRYAQSDSAIAAMQTVALAAIDLAKIVANREAR